MINSHELANEIKSLRPGHLRVAIAEGREVATSIKCTGIRSECDGSTTLLFEDGVYNCDNKEIYDDIDSLRSTNSYEIADKLLFSSVAVVNASISLCSSSSNSFSCVAGKELWRITATFSNKSGFVYLHFNQMLKPELQVEEISV